MTDQELRSLVREAIAHHVGALPITPRQPPGGPAAGIPLHASHAMFRVASGRDEGGPCIIEPAVACNHCGYCKSYGH